MQIYKKILKNKNNNNWTAQVTDFIGEWKTLSFKTNVFIQNIGISTLEFQI